MVKLIIPCYENRRVDNGQTYTVYMIDVYHNGSWRRIEKRYRDFYQFHKELKKICVTPNFPPKKMRNMNNNVIQERRKQLERYLQELLTNELAQPAIFQFLCLNQEEVKSHNEWNHLRPQSMIVFKNDLITCPLDGTKSKLPDIVLQGALEAFYSADNHHY
uniref:PX domain-containing protein n=1 Tax=Tetranychus urticae TaxID=32264 RepID=T1L070_TETUR